MKIFIYQTGFSFILHYWFTNPFSPRDSTFGSKLHSCLSASSLANIIYSHPQMLDQYVRFYNFLCENINYFYLKTLLWNPLSYFLLFGEGLFCFAVESQNIAIVNSTTHVGATGLDDNVWDLIVQHTSFIHHTLPVSKNNCWVEGTRIKKQHAYIRTLLSEMSVTPVYHSCSLLRHALPSSAGLIVSVPIKFSFMESGKGWLTYEEQSQKM